MKIQRKSQHSKKTIIWLVVAVVVLGSGYAVHAYVTSQSQPSDTTTQHESDHSADSNAVTAPDSEDTTPSGVTTDNSSKSQNSGTSDSSSSDDDEVASSLSVSLSSVQQNGATLQVRTLIKEMISEGTCSLLLEKDGKKVTRSAAIQALPSSSTCKGFDVNVSDLATGKWNITVNVTSGSSSGSTKGTIALK